MDKFAVQYLEDGPVAAALAPEDVRARLRAALDLVPISYVLLGWAVPPVLIGACRDEANRAGAQLFRWHPLLTGDGTFVPRPEWQTVGLDGNLVAGFRGMPEFTFVCPNRPAVREAVLEHLHAILQRGDYQGIFLDRIRYPSPAPDPARLLACFCDDCRRAARAEGLDLEEVRQCVRVLPTSPERAAAFVRTLLDPQAPAASDADLATLRAFLDFRTRSVTGFVQAAADLIRATGLGVGLDCFSPALTHMVGQALGDLEGCCEWIKIMSYGHALGPAGLPFELLDLADWLVAQRLGSEPEVLSWLSRVTRLPMPPSRAALREGGLAPEALAAEVRRARDSGVRTLLAGIELVEIEGVTNLNTAQIKADLRAFRDAGTDGLALSWDLWHISRERLELVRAVW